MNGTPTRGAGKPCDRAPFGMYFDEGHIDLLEQLGLSVVAAEIQKVLINSCFQLAFTGFRYIRFEALTTRVDNAQLCATSLSPEAHDFSGHTRLE
jgi:hypothetical protein